MRLLMLFLLLCTNAVFAQKKPVEQFAGITLIQDTQNATRFPNAIMYKDSVGNVIFSLKTFQQGRILQFDEGTPLSGQAAVLFDHTQITADELQYIVTQILYFEARKKIKKE